MATIQAPSFNRALFQGTYGNASMEESSVTFSAAAIGTEAKLLSLPAGIRLFMFVLLTPGLGTSVKIDLKVGNTAVASGVTLTNNIASTIGIVPFDVTENTTLSAVVQGAAATGTLTVMALYKSVGTN